MSFVMASPAVSKPIDKGVTSNTTHTAPCSSLASPLSSRSSPPQSQVVVSVTSVVVCVVVVVVVVVVEWLYYAERIIIVGWADLSDFFRPFSSVKCVFLFYVQ